MSDDPGPLVLALYLVAVNLVAMLLPPRQSAAAFWITWLAALAWSGVRVGVVLQGLTP